MKKIFLISLLLLFIPIFSFGADNTKIFDLVSIDKISKTDLDKYSIEVVSIDFIRLKGISVLARAWDKNGKQIGFGRDGSVDLERFNIINPPVLIDDPSGDIVRKIYIKDSLDNYTNKYTERILKYDPQNALLFVLQKAISLKTQKFINSNIIKNKIGNTTTIVYPDASTGANTVDGSVLATRSTTFSTSRNDTTGLTHWDTPAIDDAVRVAYGSAVSGNWDIIRAYLLFDTSDISDEDIIDSAVLSVYGSATNFSNNKNDGFDYLAVIETDPATDNNLVNGDINDIRDISDNLPLSSGVDLAIFSDKIDLGSYITSDYNDFTLDSNGLLLIDVEGFTRLGIAEGHDIESESSGWTDGWWNNVRFYYADETGTTKDPMLTIESSEEVSPPTGTATTTEEDILSFGLYTTALIIAFVVGFIITMMILMTL